MKKYIFLCIFAFCSSCFAEWGQAEFDTISGLLLWVCRLLCVLCGIVAFRYFTLRFPL